MIAGIDNRLLFGALRNLKLAPHVRGPRAGVSAPEVSGPSRPAEPPAGVAPAGPAPTAEKLALSARARALAASGPVQGRSSSRPAGRSPIERAYAEYGA